MPEVGQRLAADLHRAGGELDGHCALAGARHHPDLAVGEAHGFQVEVVRRGHHAVAGIEPRHGALTRVENAFQGAIQFGGARRSAVHRGDHLDVGGLDSQCAGDRVGHELDGPVGGLGGAGRRDHDDLKVRGVDRWQLAAAYGCRQPGDRSALSLPVQRGQLGDRNPTRGQQVGEYLPGSDRGQLRRVTDQQDVRTVGTRLE